MSYELAYSPPYSDKLTVRWYDKALRHSGWNADYGSQMARKLNLKQYPDIRLRVDLKDGVYSAVLRHHSVHHNIELSKEAQKNALQALLEAEAAAKEMWDRSMPPWANEAFKAGWVHKGFDYNFNYKD